jgi:hypothetical protein
MKKLTNASGQELKKALPAITGVRPIGNQILVEVILPDELAPPTPMYIPENAKVGTISGAPQGYVIEVGPKVDPTYGIVAGDRVVLSGTFTPLPEVTSVNGRPRACLEPHMIKAVLLEKE